MSTENIQKDEPTVSFAELQKASRRSLSLACPKCEAAIGEPCRGTASTHMARALKVLGEPDEPAPSLDRLFIGEDILAAIKALQTAMRALEEIAGMGFQSEAAKLALACLLDIRGQIMPHADVTSEHYSALLADVRMDEALGQGRR